MSNHQMVTRSKKMNIDNNINNNDNNNDNNPPIDDNEEDIDEHGNIKGLIDYSYDKPKKTIKFKKQKKRKINKSDMLSLMLSNLINNIG